MKKIYASILWSAIVFAGLCAGCRAPKATVPPPLTFGSGDRIQIVLPDRCPDRAIAKFLRAGAEMLGEAFQKSTGGKAVVIRESEFTPGPKTVFIGNTAATRKAGIDVSKLASLESVIAVRNGALYIAGKDFKNFPGFQSNPRDIRNFSLGSFRGSVIFAEKYLDVRFLLPGKNGIDFASRQQPLQLPGNLFQSFMPPLQFAHASNYFPFYNYANQYYGDMQVKLYGGHTYYDAVPRKVYQKSHPEYFAVLGGRRDPRLNHLCISNPAVADLICKELKKNFDAGADTIELAQTDGYRPCECPKCKALYGVDAPEEKLWIFHRKIAERMLIERPGKRVLIIAYGPTSKPPRTFRKFPSNVMIELCRSDPESLEAWKKYKVPQGYAAYIYNWGGYHVPGYTPKRSIRYCADQVRSFDAFGLKGLYRCGFGELFGLEGPAYYVFGKMLENPKANEYALFDEFLRRAYHEAYPPMRAFFELLDRRLELYEHAQESDPRVFLSAVYPPKVLERLAGFLKQAEKSAHAPKVKARLALVRTEFDYLRNLAEICHLYAGYELTRTPEFFNLLADKLDRRNTMIASFYGPEKRVRSIPGWPARMTYFNFAKRSDLVANGRLRGIIGAPLNWDTRMLKKHGVLPGAQRKSMTIPKVSGPVPATGFDSGVWNKAKWQSLKGLQLQKVQGKNRFKLLRNNKSLFLAFEAKIDPEKKYISFGHDGPIWSQDCAELLVDPTGTGRHYFHFAAGPGKNSRYESAFGKITDALNPLYNQADPAWNGKWHAHSTVGKNGKWEVMFEIPFKTLECSPPASGDRWLLNVAMEQFSGSDARDQIQVELTSWSPNFENMSFHNPETFGEARFK